MQWILDHFLLIILLAAGAATFAWLLAMRKRLEMKWYMALLLSVLHVLAGVACVKVFARMEGAGSGAMSIFGAVLFMPVLSLIPLIVSAMLILSSFLRHKPSAK